MALAGLLLLVSIACPIIARRSKPEFADPGGPFIGKVVEKTIDVPSGRSMLVGFRITVVDQTGRRRRITVPFAEYRRVQAGNIISRDGAGKLGVKSRQ